MKNFHTLVLALSCGAFSLQAQENITPSAYNFNALPVGSFATSTGLKHTGLGGANPNTQPTMVEGFTNKTINGFVGLGNPNVNQAVCDAFESGLNIVDLGGEIGKVLVFRGINNISNISTPATTSLGLGWASWFIYADPTTCPNTADLIKEGMSEVLAKKTATVRVEFLIHAKRNDQSSNALATSPFTFTTNAYSNNGARLVNGVVLPPTNALATTAIPYSSFFNSVYDEDTEVDVITYDPTKWLKYEFDALIPEKVGSPFYLKLNIAPSLMNDALICIKYIKFTKNPADVLPAAGVRVTTMNLNSDVSSELQNKEEKDSSARIVAADGKLRIFDLNVGENINIVTTTGVIKASDVARDSGYEISLEPGFYIVKIGNKATTVVL